MEQNDITNTQNIQYGIETATLEQKGIRAYTLYGLGLLAFAISMMILPQYLYLGLSYILPSELLQSFSIVITYLCMYLIGFPILLLIMKKVPKTEANPQAPKKLKAWQLIGITIIGYSMMNIIAMVVAVIESLLGTNATATTQYLVEQNIGLGAIFLFIMGVIVAPIMEEIIFRKIGYDRVGTYGSGLYIIWTAIMFGLLHGNLGQTIYATFLGFILAKVMYETKNVKNVIVMHMLINLFGGVGLGGIFLRTGDMTLITIWSSVVLLIDAIGIVFTIVFFVKYRGSLKNSSSASPMRNKKMAFLNIGAILYMAFMLFFIFQGILM